MFVALTTWISLWCIIIPYAHIILYYIIIQGFRKIDTDKWAFAHDNFRRDRRDLLKDIHRRRAMPAADKSNSHQSHAVIASGHQGAFVEVGKFGVEGELEQLKRDKNILMMELVRVRNQQQEMQSQMESYATRLERQEKIANNVMTFLSNAVQNPAVLGEFMSRAQSLKGSGRVRKRRQINADGMHMDIGGDVGTAEESGMALALPSPRTLNWSHQPTSVDGTIPIPDSIMRMNTSELISNLAANPELLPSDSFAKEPLANTSTVNLEELPKAQVKEFVSDPSSLDANMVRTDSGGLAITNPMHPSQGDLPESPSVVLDPAPAMTDQDFNDMMGMFEHSDLDGMSGIDMNNVQNLLSSFRVDGNRK